MLLSILFSLNTAPAALLDLSLQDILSANMNPKKNILSEKVDISADAFSLLGNIDSYDYTSKGFMSNSDYDSLISLNKNTFFMSKDEILSDSDGRISKDFSIPKSLKDRVGFWLDIYTRYDSSQSVIHDSREPWIVYTVVDTKPILAQEGKHRWTKYHEAKRHVRNERLRIQKILEDLSKKRSFNNLNEEEQRIFNLFSNYRNPKARINQAQQSVRSQTGQSDHFQAGLDRATPHLSKMELVFKEANLPIELTRIPLVESSFNPSARSKVNAAGIWQIMPNIGRQFGMMQRGKDLRFDIDSSTEVAAKLFRQKHRSLQEWPLTITSYNHGPSGLIRARRQLKTTDISEIIRRYENRRFGFASQNFYTSFLAALYAERYQDVLFSGFEPDQVISLKSSIESKKEAASTL